MVGAAGVAAVGVSVAATASNAAAAQSSGVLSGPAKGQKPFSGPGVETTTGQAMYSFPRDHAWHGGKFYQTNDFNEWHYITIIGRDLKTGERVSIFWVPLAQGWMADEGRPLHNCLFAFHNMDTGEFHTSMPYITGPLKTEGSAPDAKDFFFRYAIDDGKNGFVTDYRHATETWAMSGYNTKDDKWNQPFRLDMTATLREPGYVPMAYWGVEAIGVDPENRQNPETMFGLTYYYTAPRMLSKGKVVLKDRTVEFEGNGWFEHQWGNFRNCFQYRYFWAWFSFDNGDMISLRQYYEGTDFLNPHYNVGRYVFMDGKTFERSYAFGPSIKVIPSKMWKSPKSGKSYPWYGRIETPQGTFYYEPTHPAQEGNALAGAYIEGVIQLRSGSPEGPIVATGFTEMISLTDPLPDGNDPSLGPAVTRTLPNDPNGPWTPAIK
jgi:predicted secreted hydrolase